ncbi:MULTISPECIES: hypothetical protein [Aerosakkonema]|uniref:hypothetical protein n=1 Tax=Aerosakkonema TaxID=1246629 RepID=UPI0035BC5A3C
MPPPQDILFTHARGGDLRLLPQFEQEEIRAIAHCYCKNIFSHSIWVFFASTY